MSTSSFHRPIIVHTEYRKREGLAEMSLRVCLSFRKKIKPKGQKSLVSIRQILVLFQRHLGHLTGENWTGARLSSIAGAAVKWNCEGEWATLGWPHLVSVPFLGANGHWRSPCKSLSLWLINLDLKWPVSPGSDPLSKAQPAPWISTWSQSPSLFLLLMALPHLEGLMSLLLHYDLDWHSEPYLATLPLDALGTYLSQFFIYLFIFLATGTRMAPPHIRGSITKHSPSLKESNICFAHKDWLWHEAIPFQRNCGVYCFCFLRFCGRKKKQLQQWTP